MKKIYLFLFVFAFATHFSSAQNSNPWPTSGNVGIGTITPGTTLEVNGTATIGTSSSYRMTLGTVSSVPTLQTVSSSLAINPAGNNVGIGTTAPGSALAVNGAISLSNLNAFPSGAGIFQGSNTLQMVSGTAGFAVNNNANTVVNLVVLNSGNVGIGTTSPFAKVSIVTSGSGNPLSFQANSAGAWTVGPNVGSTSGDDTFGIYSYTYGSGHGSAPLIQFNSSTGNTFINQSSGNVLIGQTTQTNPAYKLDVLGSARANEIVVNVTGADFVFNPSYKLNSLSALEKYIKANHHLPEIPSAKEMEANGLSVGENQVKLLQKVEELTLYLIGKDKQIAKEQKRNNEQQKEIDELKQQVKTLLKPKK